MPANWGMMNMAQFGLAHWLMFAIAVVLVIYPVGRILGRIGFSPLWSIVAIFPLFNLIGLWIVAFTDWPKRGSTGT